MKSIEFETEHVDPIQAGDKTATVRIDEAGEIEQGEHVRLETPDGRVFATARIVSLVDTFVGGALHAIHVFDAEYPTDSTSVLIDALGRHYDREIRRETPCRVLCWEPGLGCDPDALAEADCRGGYQGFDGPEGSA